MHTRKQFCKAASGRSALYLCWIVALMFVITGCNANAGSVYSNRGVVTYSNPTNYGYAFRLRGQYQVSHTGNIAPGKCSVWLYSFQTNQLFTELYPGVDDPLGTKTVGDGLMTVPDVKPPYDLEMMRGGQTADPGTCGTFSLTFTPVGPDP